MASPREIRRLAFQLLFQLDARPELEDADLRSIAEACVQETGLEARPAELDKAVGLARNAYEHRNVADGAMEIHAPTWPAHRQPAADRSILRIAHYEMTSTDINPKIPVNEAVELAKDFGTERSPGFVNAVLDKILKQILAESASTGGEQGA